MFASCLPKKSDAHSGAHDVTPPPLNYIRIYFAFSLIRSDFSRDNFIGAVAKSRTNFCFWFYTNGRGQLIKAKKMWFKFKKKLSNIKFKDIIFYK